MTVSGSPLQSFVLLVQYAFMYVRVYFVLCIYVDNNNKNKNINDNNNDSDIMKIMIVMN